jgi:hypothetical protein
VCYEGGPWVPRTGRGWPSCVFLYGWTLVWGILLSGYFLMERGGSWVGGNFHSITTIILMGIWEWVMVIGFPFLSLSILFLFVYARRWGSGGVVRAGASSPEELERVVHGSWAGPLGGRPGGRGEE